MHKYGARVDKGVDGLESMIHLLPTELRCVLGRLPFSITKDVQEVRLRAGQAVALGIRGEERYVTAGGVCTVSSEAAVRCEERWLRAVVDRVCEQSVYAHQEELRCGFLSAPNGCRVGVAGTAVVEHGRVISFRNITSVCVRVARQHRGCAAHLAERLFGDGVVAFLP